MSNDFFIRAINLPLETFYLVLALSGLRFIGLAYGFVVFGWGLSSNQTLRIGVSLILSIPIMIAAAAEIEALVSETSPFRLVLIAVKEFALGYGLGLLASAPFRSLAYAGEITDTFRGENNSGITSPDGGQMSTLSNFYFVIGVYVFVGIGGLVPLIALVYSSYAIWPISGALPTFFAGAGEIVIHGIGKGLELALVICAPLMILFLSIEFILIISAKAGRRFGLYNMSFTIKNLVMVLSLPVLAMVIVGFSEEYTQFAVSALSTLESILE